MFISILGKNFRVSSSEYIYFKSAATNFLRLASYIVYFNTICSC